jgi:hypothetical protein
VVCSVEFLELLEQRQSQLQNNPHLHIEFIREMKCFLPPQVVADTIEKKQFWEYLVNVVVIECEAIVQTLKDGSEFTGFKM